MRDRARYPAAAVTMAALSGFVFGMGFYVLVEFAFLWGDASMMPKPTLS